MERHLDLERYPLHDLQGARGRALVEQCKLDLAERGMFNLPGFLRPDALARSLSEVSPLFGDGAFLHKRSHNIYFAEDIAGLAPDHPALMRLETTNHTLCADQFPESVICAIYEWPPLARFIAAVLDKPRLHTMTDPLARANVMAYRAGEALNWHFDRSEFTTTLLLQAPESGGQFQYRTGLRSESDPNYDGVARLLRGEDPEVETLELSAGTLNIFKGRDTAHRVTPPQGEKARMIAVFSYYERPGVMFSDEERIGFYGRAA
jgi:hypothetical protein